jgi:RNA polymerase sigma-70 factor (ECF subfamily)
MQEEKHAPVRGEVDRIEAELLEKAQAGDPFAFQEIVKRYQNRVYGVAFRIVRRHDVADDVAQETFLRAYRKLDLFDVGRPFGPWISRIAANLTINHVRSPVSREEELDEDQHERSTASGSPLDGVLEQEARDLLEAALAGLPTEQRAVFVLRMTEELSYREIADTLQISIGTVMSRLSRAREKLRLALAGYLSGPMDGAQR